MHVAGGRRRKKDDRAGEVVGPSPPAGGNAIENLTAPHRIRAERLRVVRLHVAWRDCVHIDPVRRPFVRERLRQLRETAFRDPKSYFHRYSKTSEKEAAETAISIWTRINLVNLRENILPTRQRASLILRKGTEHEIETVALRKL